MTTLLPRLVCKIVGHSFRGGLYFGHLRCARCKLNWSQRKAA